jgi:hypothetical protein
MITKRNNTQSLFFDLECIAPDLLNNYGWNAHIITA